MKRKITDSLAVITLLIIAIACLLPIMESLSGPFPPKSADEEETGEEGTGKEETGKEKIGEPDKSELEVEQGEKEGGEGTLYSESGVASLRDSGAQPAEPLFKVRGAENTRLLRSFAVAIYDGQLWRFDENSIYREYYGEELPYKVTGFSSLERDSISIIPLVQFSGFIPTSLYPVHVSLESPLRYYSNEFAFYSESSLQAPYSFTTIHYNFKEDELLRATVVYDESNLQLPESLPQRVKNLAYKITEGYTSPYEKLKAIEAHLKSNYKYDLFFTPAPIDREPNDWFLFEEKKGVCVNFNSAFVVLARAVGIPARLVCGYAIEPKMEEQTVLSTQRHTWAEVQFEDLGWIGFDATSQVAVEIPRQSIPTDTTIMNVSYLAKKGHTFYVEGNVRTTEGIGLDDISVEIYLNAAKAQGGTLCGEGRTTNGYFKISCEAPTDIEVGDYHIIAHALEKFPYLESWSDPQVKIVTATSITLTAPEKANVNQTFYIKGNLSEEFGEPVTNQIVVMHLDRESISSLTTGEDGVFSFQYSFSRVGDYRITVRYIGTDYYEGSTSTVNVKIMMPTKLTLTAPEEVNAGETFKMQGSLTEQTGKPIVNHEVKIYSDNDELIAKVKADEKGVFSYQYAIREPGTHKIVGKFDETGYYLKSQSTASIQVIEVEFPWLYLAVIPLLSGGVVGGYLIYKKKSKIRITKTVSDVAVKKESPLESAAVTESRGSVVNIVLSFPQIKRGLPDVWGLNDVLKIDCTLLDGEGQPIPDKKLRTSIGEQLIGEVALGKDGRVSFLHVFESRGEYVVTCDFQGDDRYSASRSARTIRIVDYREEIVNLFNSILQRVQKQGMGSSKESTPREVEAKLLSSYKAVDGKALGVVVECFEEAEYSLHPIQRRNYELMAPAWKLVMESIEGKI